MERIFKIKPYGWQLEAISLAEKNPNLALLAEMGTGKTKAVIEILRDRFFENKRLMRTLVLGPIAVVHNWKEELLAHTYLKPEQIAAITGTGATRLKTLTKATVDVVTKEAVLPRVVVLNYEALLTSSLFALLKEWQPEIIICDESHLLKNPKSRRAKAVYELSKDAKHRYIMTGTPILNSPEDIFQQYKVLDGGETFGTNYYTFMNKYFYDANQAWSGKPGHFKKMVPKEELFDKLTDLIYSKAIRVLKKDCLDLPPRILKTVPVELSIEQKAAYEQMKRDLVTFIKDQEDGGQPKAVVAQLAITKALRMMQIVSGFATDEDGNTVDMGSIPRLKATEELLEEITPNHKVIIWCSFKHNYAQLSKLCEKMNIGYAIATGEQNAEQKQEAIQSFRTDQKVRVFIANRRAMGTGINLVEADYSIGYSRNFSLAEELQSQDRNYRGGSQIHASIVKIDLVATDTIDELCVQALRDKRSLADRIIDVAREL